MKLNRPKELAFIISACFLIITTFSYAQFKTENRTSSSTPVITKGYYSIYNNADKLNSSAGRLIFSNKISASARFESNISATQKKGYYFIGKNAEKKRAQMTTEGIDFSNQSPARVILSNTFPVIKKGYYSIGDNAQKLHK